MAAHDSVGLAYHPHPITLTWPYHTQPNSTPRNPYPYPYPDPYPCPDPCPHYTQVNALVRDPANKYTNAEACLLHTPEQVRMLLDCD